jgi:uncharacterized protein
VAQRCDSLELGRLRLSSGEGTRVALSVALDPLDFGGRRYAERQGDVDARLDVSHTTRGYSLRLRFEARLAGPCMRCLEPAEQLVEVDAREVDQPGGGDELRSPYLEDDVLDLHAWARDAVALALPVQIVCREGCLGLCPECGANLNEAGPEHRHERSPDPRWARLRELRLE